MILTLVLIGLFFLGLLVAGLVSCTFTKSVSGFVAAGELVTISDQEGLKANPNILPSQPAVLTTHTTNTTGTITMNNSNHGIITGQRIDIYWAGGQCYGAIVGTVSGTTVPIASVSGGSNLPASSTVIRVGVPVETVMAITGNNMGALIMAAPTYPSYFVFVVSGPTDSYAAFVTAGTVATWKTGDAGTNPLAGIATIDVWMSVDSGAAGTATATDTYAAAITH